MAVLLSSSRMKLFQLILVTASLCCSKCAKPEAGKLIVSDISKDNSVLNFIRSMYAGTEISVFLECESQGSSQIKVEWLVRRSPCANEYSSMEMSQFPTTMVMDKPGDNYLRQAEDYTETEYMKGVFKLNCSSKADHMFLPEQNVSSPIVVQFVTSSTKAKEGSTTPASTSKQKEGGSSSQDNKKTEGAGGAAGNQRAKRDAGTPKPAAGEEPNKNSAKPTEKPGANTNAVETAASKDEKKSTTVAPHSTTKSPLEGETFMKVWKDGYYLLVLRFTEIENTEKDFKVQVTVKSLWNEKYIAAVDWPLLIFYGVMGLVYVGYGLFWLVMLACNWRDLLRIQFWIGAVILLGMLEKAVFFAEYENISSQGIQVPGAIIFAELVSCVKRGLARMLVIIVSLGFGIVKPRLGQTLHKVVLAGVLYIVLASVESCMRVLKVRADQSTEQLYAAVPLAITDAVICWWIFSCLLQTTRTLRLRRNVVKLSLYRHFTNTLIFAVIASVAYMIWFLTQHRFKLCLKDWKELWVDEAFWHLLFSVILFIIMVLWRPTVNNQRYAFSPLLDAAEDDLDDDQVLSEAFDGMKMRTTKPQQRNGSPFEEKKLEDDLKWVEENIPSSIADKLLPALDSDEEIMNTKFEVSKME